MTDRPQVYINPNAFVVLEGMDATGKSTQLDRFSMMRTMGGFRNKELLLTHQPSGGSDVGKAVYEITENSEIKSPLSRQLLHLASHAEHYEREILPALDRGTPVIMDRCWWSTICYGYDTNPQLQRQFEYDDFRALAKAPAQGMEPDVVFLFLEPWAPDRHNSPQLKAAYERLAEIEKANTMVIMVPQLSPEDIFYHMMRHLVDLELAE